MAAQHLAAGRLIWKPSRRRRGRTSLRQCRKGLAEDCVCVTDGHPSYEMASRSLNIHQEVVRVSRRELRRGSWHLNTVNPRHMTMKRWLNHHHRGVSTRYLDHYMRGLMRSEFKLEESMEADFLSPHLANYTQVDT